MPMADFSDEFASPADYAQMYRSHGVQVVPAFYPKPEDPGFSWKRPCLKSWQDLQRELVNDLVFNRWYGSKGEHVERTQMGMVCGAASSNICVVDLDTHVKPQAAIWWQDAQQSAVETWEQTTGGGGTQLFFRFPRDFIVPTIKTAIGVDIRGQGGFAMMPPSMHSSGNQYRWKEGCAPHECEIEDAPQWLMDAIRELYQEHGGSTPTDAPRQTTESPEAAFNEFGLMVDGREDYARRIIWASIVEWYREAPFQPGPTASADRMRDVYTVYEHNTASRIKEPGTPKAVLLEREGRGASMFEKKWKAAFAQWDDKIKEYASQPRLAPEGVKDEPQPSEEDFAAQGQAEDVYEVLDLEAIEALPPPSWLVENVIPEGGLTFVYGKPGKGKSFLTLDLALRLAHGLDWHGKECKPGGVLYIAGEGKGGYRNRVAGWHRKHGLSPNGEAFRLLPLAPNFMVEADIQKLVRTVKACVGNARLVIVDTVARAIPGAEENASKEIGLFVKSCDAIRDECDVAVIGVHHSGKDEERGMRGSSALEGAGDCVIHLKREEGSQNVTLHVEKQKDGEAIAPLAFTLETVEWQDGIKTTTTLVPTLKDSVKQPDLMPDRATIRAILQAIDQAWKDKRPWSTATQTKKEGRYAARLIGKQFGTPPDIAERLVLELLDNGLLSVATLNSDSKLRGLRVEKWND